MSSTVQISIGNIVNFKGTPGKVVYQSGTISVHQEPATYAPKLIWWHVYGNDGNGLVCLAVLSASQFEARYKSKPERWVRALRRKAAKSMDYKRKRLAEFIKMMDRQEKIWS